MMAIRCALAIVLIALSSVKGQDPVECIHPYVEVGGRCLLIDPWVKGSMETIRYMCIYHSGDLLWLDDVYDCDFYRALMDHLHENKLNEHDYWLGITDERHEGIWRYLKNDQDVRMGAPYWAVNNPDGSEAENCAAMLTGNAYYWADVKCDSEYSGICRYAK
ncbi:perlucin-like protein [Macrobrachium rosenbergii]|uniref:perlucin-like protein n=1 Tax=Macrobrachium rosenbergii TaxID=79674 RepID=UPI0034D506A7